MKPKKGFSLGNSTDRTPSAVIRSGLADGSCNSASDVDMAANTRKESSEGAVNSIEPEKGPVIPVSSQQQQQQQKKRTAHQNGGNNGSGSTRRKAPGILSTALGWSKSQAAEIAEFEERKAAEGPDKPPPPLPLPTRRLAAAQHDMMKAAERDGRRFNHASSRSKTNNQKFINILAGDSDQAYATLLEDCKAWATGSIPTVAGLTQKDLELAQQQLKNAMQYRNTNDDENGSFPPSDGAVTNAHIRHVPGPRIPINPRASSYFIQPGSQHHQQYSNGTSSRFTINSTQHTAQPRYLRRSSRERNTKRLEMYLTLEESDHDEDDEDAKGTTHMGGDDEQHWPPRGRGDRSTISGGRSVRKRKNIDYCEYDDADAGDDESEFDHDKNDYKRYKNHHNRLMKHNDSSTKQKRAMRAHAFSPAGTRALSASFSPHLIVGGTGLMQNTTTDLSPFAQFLVEQQHATTGGFQDGPLSPPSSMAVDAVDFAAIDDFMAGLNFAQDAALFNSPTVMAMLAVTAPGSALAVQPATALNTITMHDPISETIRKTNQPMPMPSTNEHMNNNNAIKHLQQTTNMPPPPPLPPSISPPPTSPSPLKVTSPLRQKLPPSPPPFLPQPAQKSTDQTTDSNSNNQALNILDLDLAGCKPLETPTVAGLLTAHGGLMASKKSSTPTPLASPLLSPTLLALQF